MKNSNLERCALVLKLNPLEPGTIVFRQTPAPYWSCYNNPASSDEPETVCEGCYEIEDNSIFAWSSVPSVGHYRWLRGPIHRLPPNSKADYLVRTIWHILYFLQLWTMA
jgi:hypothetical protein